jgi:hypothetical protein
MWVHAFRRGIAWRVPDEKCGGAETLQIVSCFFAIL